MANLFGTTHKYLTVQDVRDSTTDEEILALSDSEIHVLISKAEQKVLIYLGYEAETNADIQLATFYTLDHIFHDDGTPQIKSESSFDRSWTYELGEKNINKFGLPDEAVTILNQYRITFFKQVL